MKNLHTERGSAIILILVAVALFAALSYALFQGGRSSQSNLTAEQARIAAQDIIQYADGMGKTVQKLRLAGCTDTQISYDRAGSATYDNGSAPSDESCNILSLSGGKLNIVAPPANALDTAKLAQALYGDWYASGKSCIPNIGTGSAGCNAASQSDLTLILPWIKLDVCKAINKILTGSDTIPAETGNAYDAAAPWTGSYPAPYEINSAGNDMNQKGSLCFQGAGANPNGGYHFYAVLIAR